MASNNVILCVVSALIACISSTNGMLNGINAEKGQFPYMAAFYYDSEYYPSAVCGGAIISDRYILTVAYPMEQLVNNSSKILIYPGAWEFTDDAVTTTIEQIKLHPDWKLGSKRNDIALVKTVDQMIFSEFIKPISLPVKDFLDKSGALVVVSGFGAEFIPQHIKDIMHRTHTLQFQTTKTLDTKECKQQYSELSHSYVGAEEIDKEFICTENGDGKAMCRGDIGNPLVTGNTLVGIFSWSFECSTNYPNVYTKVYTHLKWIKKEIKN